MRLEPAAKLRLESDWPANTTLTLIPLCGCASEKSAGGRISGRTEVAETAAEMGVAAYPDYWARVRGRGALQPTREVTRFVARAGKGLGAFA